MAYITEQLDVSGPVVYGYLRLPGSSPERRRALTLALTDYCHRHELALAAVFTDPGDGPHGTVLTAAFTGLLDALDVDGVYGAVLPSPDHLGDRSTALHRYARITASGRRLMFARGEFTATPDGTAGHGQTSPPRHEGFQCPAI